MKTCKTKDILYEDFCMNTFYLSFSVVFPIVCMLSLGYSLTLMKVFDDIFLKKANMLNFEVFLPILLFISIYRSDFNFITIVPLLVFAVITTILIFIALFIYIPKIIKEREDISVVIQGAYRSNFVLFGLPITASLYGIENITIISIMIAIIIPLYNILAVIVLQTYSDKSPSFFTVGKELIKNPLIIASFLAISLVSLEVEIPLLLEKTMLDISRIATPFALIILGGCFKLRGIKKYIKSLTIGVCIKLFIIPLIFIPLSILFSFRGIELIGLVAMYATPTAITSFTMAQAMGANDELAGQIVVLSSIFSVFTIFICIMFLQYGNLLQIMK